MTLPKWDEVKKVKLGVKDRYGKEIEIPVEDCWMPDGRNIYITLKISGANNKGVL
jgi:hypothetical protein